MKATTHGEHLVKLTRLGAFNCYLVREADGLTLVDTGLPGSARSILAAAEAHGGRPRRIALTHAHGDHIGSLDALVAELGGVEVSMGERESRLLEKRELEPGEPQAKIRGGFPSVKTRPSRLLSPGDRVGSLEVVAAPGHTPGQIAFLDVRDRTLIAADALQTLGGVAVAGVVRPLFPLPAMATWHKPTSVETARALRALEPARLAVGHGRVLEQPAAAKDEAIEAAG